MCKSAENEAYNYLATVILIMALVDSSHVHCGQQEMEITIEEGSGRSPQDLAAAEGL